MCFLLQRCFSCSHTVLPKEHSLGVIFFSLHSSCFAVFFFNSLSSCPVYPIVIYVCCVWTGRWLISLVLVTSDNKGLLLHNNDKKMFVFKLLSLRKETINVIKLINHNSFCDSRCSRTVYCFLNTICTYYFFVCFLILYFMFSYFLVIIS